MNASISLSYYPQRARAKATTTRTAKNFRASSSVSGSRKSTSSAPSVVLISRKDAASRLFSSAPEILHRESAPRSTLPPMRTLISARKCAAIWSRSTSLWAKTASKENTNSLGPMEPTIVGPPPLTRTGSFLAPLLPFLPSLLLLLFQRLRASSIDRVRRFLIPRTDPILHLLAF